ncbi:type II toxin-antitoxin system RelE/ParE family toxin [Bradyrhizobium murdochi]|uniref:type II toxin-antitoxin system RelE/ParE family toxin n=1 Tax=Bradyrhizobium murdochi TaxID=1038859 RepID=UPI000A028B20|nr:type II toxin-antitoxin system RelE/ParE family toxin [Bradyrhizobium murdochi]
MPWQVEILDETVAAEIAALPADMQARFLRLAERIASAGLESLSGPHVKHLEGKLWELRLRGRDGIAQRTSHDHPVRKAESPPARQSQG